MKKIINILLVSIVCVSLLGCAEINTNSDYAAKNTKVTTQISTINKNTKKAIKNFHKSTNKTINKMIKKGTINE